MFILEASDRYARKLVAIETIVLVSFETTSLAMDMKTAPAKTDAFTYQPTKNRCARLKGEL